MLRVAESIVPAGFHRPARRLYLRARAALLRGDRVGCPCCGGRFSRFLGIGSPSRAAACPGCDSRERQRLLLLYLQRETPIFRDSLQVLHVAPEDCLQDLLRHSRNLEYLSADRSSPSAMVHLDVMNTGLPDATFDVVLCSHVLEHVQDDRVAMRELFRILRPGGWAILQVPIDPLRERTFEDPSVTDPADRERLFGQWDHVRVYGRDYPDRLAGAGFEVRVVPYARSLGPDAARTFGLNEQEQIHHCTRPAAPARDPQDPAAGG